MRQERSSQNLVIVLLAIAVLAMTVGFATYSQNLTITGTATFKKASWSVQFDDTTWDESGSSTGVSSSAHNVGTTAATYTVTLNKPGDVFTFDLDVKNAGTIDAKLTEIDLTNSQSSAAYISHSVTYDGVTYSNATNANINKVLAAGNSETVTVRVEYVPAAANALPSSADVTATLGVTLQYVDNGI